MITPEQYTVLLQHAELLKQYSVTRSLRFFPRDIILCFAEIYSPQKTIQLYCSACVRQMLDKLLQWKQEYEKGLPSVEPA